MLVGKLAYSWEKRGGNFGSLKEINERKIELMTAEQEPVENVQWVTGRDYIVVVAARTKFKDSMGNQYRFVNCGLRQLRLFPEVNKDNYSIQRIFLMFQQGYVEKGIELINEYVEELSGRVVYVKDKAEFIKFLNSRKDKNRVIKEVVILCHGIIDTASFDYHHENKGKEKTGEFKSRDVVDVQEAVFDYDAVVTTYACRAGISVDGKDLTGMDAGQENSPAQKMADCWDVSVRAFEMRSDYSSIYGTKKEIRAAENYEDVIEEYEESLSGYNKKKANGDVDITPPQKPENYDEMSKRYDDVTARDANAKRGAGPIAPNGAWRMPGTGDSPEGLKEGLQTYQPGEWTL